MLTSGIRGAGAINAVDGLNVNDISPIAFLVKREGNTPQTIADGIKTNLTFNEIRPIGDSRGLLSVDDISEFPTAYKGYYSIAFDGIVAGITIDKLDTYIIVTVDNTDINFQYGQEVGIVGGKTGLKFNFNLKVYAEESIELKVHAKGTELVHAHIFPSNIEVILIQC